MLVTSRSFEEYRACFDLDDALLRAGRVLDCAAGASGFTAMASAQGCDVTAADPAYDDHDAAVAEAAVSVDRGRAIIDAHDSRFTWDWYGDAAHRDQLRALAFGAFVEDLRVHPERYVPAALPDLPFADGAFRLALCSHLLFTWADLLDEAWHLAALRELLRVAAEVRVFPLVRQGAGEPVLFLPALVETLRAEGVDAEVLPVPYRFQVTGDRMLRLRRPPS